MDMRTAKLVAMINAVRKSIAENGLSDGDKLITANVSLAAIVARAEAWDKGDTDTVSGVTVRNNRAFPVVISRLDTLECQAVAECHAYVGYHITGDDFSKLVCENHLMYAVRYGLGKL